MTRTRKMMRGASIAAVAMSLALPVGSAIAQDAPPAGPATAPQSPATAPAGARVSPEAQKIIDTMKAAYEGVDSLALEGQLSANFELGGQKRDEKASFTGSFAAPNKFKHEIDKNLLAGSTGQTTYVYHKGDNAYISEPLSSTSAKFPAEKFPQPQGSILRDQDPSLLLALSADVPAELLAGVASAEKGEDVTIDAKAYPALKLTQTDGVATTMVLDPTTHLIRRVTHDMKPVFEKQGVPDVKSAQLTIDYSTVTVNGGAAGADAFAWTPPEGARQASTEPPPAADGQQRPAMALEGKPAPDFTLSSLKDEKVKLSDQKGSVVVLDFWATWCGPCVGSMPHLEKLHKDLSEKGLKVYAVNQQEDKDTVDSFIKDNKYTFNVLLDSEGSVGQQYKANAIPETVVVGKDGVVKKVFIGAGPDTAERLREAVTEAMKAE